MYSPDFLNDEDKWISVEKLIELLKSFPAKTRISARTGGNTGNIIVRTEDGRMLGYVDIGVEEFYPSLDPRKEPS